MKPIVIAAGGTGGHFFPAEALAVSLISRGERVVLMTDARSAAARSPVFGGGEIHVIAGAGVVGRSLSRAAAGVAAIGAGVLAARRILGPLSAGAVVGFGSYASVAPLVAARGLRRRPVLILHDQNAVLGRANRLLARLADEIAISFPGTGGVPARRRSILTGNPVRPAIVAHRNAPYPPPGDSIKLLVLGGSLGASAFATLVPAALARLPQSVRNKIVLTMQCPAPSLASARESLAAAGVTHTLAPFFEDVAGLLAQSQLVIARAGGSTVAELAVIGRPAVLIPLTINADQRANAGALETAGGAIRFAQSEGAAKLAELVETLLGDPARLAAMAAASAKAGIADAAERLASLTIAAIAAAPAREETTR